MFIGVSVLICFTKIIFPLFFGADAYGWVNRVERCFDLKRVVDMKEHKRSW